jgi:uncharacterized coiled-coil DUF342 family protein
MAVLDDLEVAYKLLCEAENTYNLNLEGLHACEKEESDLKHLLETQKLTYHEEARVSIKLTEVLQKRRKYKDALEVLEPLKGLMQEKESTTFRNKLSSVLGATRKAEASHQNRPYFPRTAILDTMGMNKFKE